MPQDVKPKPEYVTEQKPKKETVEEVPITSLGEMIEEMKKKEEVKIESHPRYQR